MTKHYTKLLDQLDNLMISLTKQKHLGLDPEIMKALKDLTRSRNAFKRELIKSYNLTKPNETVLTHLLDNVMDNT